LHFMSPHIFLGDKELLYFIVRVEVIKIQIWFEFNLVCNLQKGLKFYKGFLFSLAYWAETQPAQLNPFFFLITWPSQLQCGPLSRPSGQRRPMPSLSPTGSLHHRRKFSPPCSS
jgi:hypothetical protein